MSAVFVAVLYKLVHTLFKNIYERKSNPWPKSHGLEPPAGSSIGFQCRGDATLLRTPASESFRSL